MNKMTRPEMNVIRFNEADVIVASGGLRPGSTITMNMGSTKPGDAVVTHNSTAYKMQDYSTWSSYLGALENAFGTQPLNATMKLNANYTLQTLLEKEYDKKKGLKDPAAWTGDFYYDGTQFIKNNELLQAHIQVRLLFLYILHKTDRKNLTALKFYDIIINVLK